MSQDDPTTKLPDDEAKYDTKPGITAVLERINELGDKLSGEIASLRGELEPRFDRLETNVSGLISQIKLLDMKVDKLAVDILKVRAEQGLLEERFDKLERKPS